MDGDDDSTAAEAPATPQRRPGVRTLAVGVLLAVGLGFGILLLAGTLGVTGVVLAGLVEAALVWLLWRWSPAP